MERTSNETIADKLLAAQLKEYISSIRAISGLRTVTLIIIFSLSAKPLISYFTGEVGGLSITSAVILILLFTVYFLNEIAELLYKTKEAQQAAEDETQAAALGESSVRSENEKLIEKI